jgi:hypothetical protein
MDPRGGHAVSCHDLDRWIGDGMLAALPEALRAHARGCARCAAHLRAAEELDQALFRAAPPAPADFVREVMARLSEVRPVRPRVPLTEVLPFLQPLPWWVRVAIDPAAILATLVLSLWLWQGKLLLALVASGGSHLVAWLGQLTPVLDTASASIWLQPAMLTAIALAAAPLALMSSRLLFDWTARLAGPPIRRFGH